MKPISPAELVAMRKATGLNQSAFWGRIGVTQSGGSRYEGGRRMPKPVQIVIEIAYGGKPMEVVKRLRKQ